MAAHIQQTSEGKKSQRQQSFYGVNPYCKFGPKAAISERNDALLQIPNPSSQQLQWTKTPESVLIVRKIFDLDIIPSFYEVMLWLLKKKGMVVYVESRAVTDSDIKAHHADLSLYQERIHTFTAEEDIVDKVDLIICLGGDGTLLHASSLFQDSVPPVMAFHLGSLGFLMSFEFEDFKEEITLVLDGNAYLTLRSRLACHLHKNSPTLRENKMPFVESGVADVNSSKRKQTKDNTILVLNEVVIERGHSSILTYLDLYIDSKLVTSLQGDGLIIATPTGSTAYSLAAGASMVHPSVPSILITPICPHSLSFRPIILPAGFEIKVMLSPDSRNSAWVSFDGRNRQEIVVGDSVVVTTAKYPVPHVRRLDARDDWFSSLAQCLHWNIRKPQRSLSNVSCLSDSNQATGCNPTNGESSKAIGGKM